MARHCFGWTLVSTFRGLAIARRKTPVDVRSQISSNTQQGCHPEAMWTSRAAVPPHRPATPGFPGELIAMSAKLDKDRPPIAVSVYDSGEDQPFTAGRFAIPTALIEAAGGRTIMDNGNTSWTKLSWGSWHRRTFRSVWSPALSAACFLWQFCASGKASPVCSPA